MNPERSIPTAVLKGAKGLAILTVAKAGALVSYKLGTGLVVARRQDGSWSAPSAILPFGLGWGAQVITTLRRFCGNIFSVGIVVTLSFEKFNSLVFLFFAGKQRTIVKGERFIPLICKMMGTNVP